MSEQLKRKRSPNWHVSEKMLLLSVVEEGISILENKKTDGATMRQKNKAWEEAAEKYNSSTNFSHRTAANLKAEWELLKKAAKKHVANKRIAANMTGGGPPKLDVADDPLFAKIISLISHAALGYYNPYDSDLATSQPLEAIEVSNADGEGASQQTLTMEILDQEPSVACQQLIDCINKLDKLPITVRHLEKTGIGKTINALRKIDGEVGNVAKALVWKWKRMVIAEAVAEERAERERRLRDPTVSSSDENFPNSDRAEEEEPTNVEEDTNSTLSSTTGNDGTAAAAGVLQETCEEECTSSTANQIVNVSKYESDHCDTLQPSTEGEDNIQVPIDSASHPPPLNQNSPKDRKEKDSHSYHHHHHKHYRHSSKHHSNSSSSTSRKDRPKEKKKSKHRDKAEAGRSESETRVDDFKVKIKTEKVDTDDEKEEQEEKTESSGSSSKHKQHSKRAESERKTSEKKYHHKEREQKRKSDHSARNPENIPKHSKSSEKAKKMKITIADDDSIDCFSGASFAEALGMGDTRKKKKSSSSTSAVGNTPSGGSPSSKITKKPSTSTRETAPTKPELLLADIKLEPLDVEVDLASTLPEISPNYKPLPHVPSPSKLRKGRPLTEEAAALNQAVTQVILSKQQRQRTKVYSGVKTGGPIPTLYDLCVHVLKENIDALEYTGGVPYDILKPILQQATPEQLFQLEHYNPYLIEDTDELWDFHCRKEFRTGQRLQMETAREMYLRCLDEREAKLKALTCNIQQSLAKSTPVRQTKLAYVDSVAKPPRNVARQQAKYGTGSIPKPIVGKPEKNVSVSKPSTSTSGATSCFSQRSTQSNARVKPRMAPLMQKTMKLAKSFKR